MGRWWRWCGHCWSRAESHESEVVNEICYMDSIQPGTDLTSTLPEGGGDQADTMDKDIGEEVSRTLERQLLLKDRKAEIKLGLPFQRINIPDHQERPVIVRFLIMKPSEVYVGYYSSQAKFPF